MNHALPIMKKILTVIALTFLSSGCIPQAAINKSITQYDQTAHQVALGDSKETVLALLLPSQAGLNKMDQKKPEQFLLNGKRVEIYFMRSAWHSDGLTTDDEFTPYVFMEGKLMAIGWAALGGPKTQGQAGSNIFIKSGSSSSPSRASQQIMNHGAGGCTPNFSTGGCL